MSPPYLPFNTHHKNISRILIVSICRCLCAVQGLFTLLYILNNDFVSLPDFRM